MLPHHRLSLIHNTTGKCQGLTITPFNAGHTLGGTIWKIRSPSAGTIVYAVNMNHMKERHLDGTILMRQAAGGVYEPLARPDLLITDADRAAVLTSRRKDRDAALIGMWKIIHVYQYPNNPYRHDHLHPQLTSFAAHAL